MGSIPSDSEANLSRGNLRGRLVDDLRRQLGSWEAGGALEAAGTLSCGAPAIDRLLPGGGLRRGMLIEWVAGPSEQIVQQQQTPGRLRQAQPGGAGGCRVAGSGAVTLGLLGAREACREGGVLVVVDRRQTFYPPAAAAWGIDLDRLIVVHPRNARDELWAAVQALRSPAVAAMWAAIERLDSRAFRRLQLAAEAGRTLGVLVRPAGAQAEPSWADLRLEVRTLQNANCKMQIANWGNSAINNFQFSIFNFQSPNSRRIEASSLLRRVHVCVTRCRNGRAGGSAVLEIDDAAYIVREASSTYDTHPLPVVAELGDSAGRSRSARA